METLLLARNLPSTCNWGGRFCVPENSPCSSISGKRDTGDPSASQGVEEDSSVATFAVQDLEKPRM
jgi:hypothetical protein